MENFITKSKYFNDSFNTAIFSDPIRIYFSQKHEAHALEIYSHMQKRKNKWERFLKSQANGKYCYIMLYSDDQEYAGCFENGGASYSPESFGDDYVVGINGPLETEELDRFLETMDSTIAVSQ